MDELTREQRDQLARRLEQLRQELDALLLSTSASSRPVELEQPIGRLSRVDALQQQQMAQANRRSQQQRLQQVEAALLALRRGDYGECRICEEPIGFARLSARPESPLCRACQGEREGER